MSWCIGFYLKFSFPFWKHENWLTCYLFFQFFFLFTFLLAFEFIKRFCYVTEVLDKLSIEICEYQKAFHFFYFGGSFLFLDCFDFVGFHLYLFSSNDYSKNWDLLHVEITFWLFKTEIMFFLQFSENELFFLLVSL